MCALDVERDRDPRPSGHERGLHPKRRGLVAVAACVPVPLVLATVAGCVASGGPLVATAVGAVTLIFSVAVAQPATMALLAPALFMYRDLLPQGDRLLEGSPFSLNLHGMIQIAAVSFGVFLLLFCGKYFTGGRRPPLTWWIALAGFSALGMFLSGLRPEGVRLFIHLWGAIFVSATVWLARTETRRLLEFLLVLSAPALLFGLWQLSGLGLAVLLGGFRPEEVVASVFNHRAPWGMLLVFVFLVGVGTLLGGQRRFLRHWAIVPTAVAFMLLLLNNTRVVWVAAVAGVSALLIAGRRFLLVAVAVPLLIAALALLPNVRSRVGLDSIPSYSSLGAWFARAPEMMTVRDRLRNWEELLATHETTMERVIGKGLGFSREFFAADPFRPATAHNEYLTVLVDTGFVGLLLLVGAFLDAARRLLKRSLAEARSEMGIPVSAIGVGLVTAYASFCLTDNIMHYSHLSFIYWWAIFACMRLTSPAKRRQGPRGRGRQAEKLRRVIEASL